MPREVATKRIFSSPIRRGASPKGRIKGVCPCCLELHRVDDGQYIEGYFSPEHKAFWLWCKKCIAKLGQVGDDNIQCVPETS